MVAAIVVDQIILGIRRIQNIGGSKRFSRQGFVKQKLLVLVQQQHRGTNQRRVPSYFLSTRQYYIPHNARTDISVDNTPLLC